MNFEYYMALAIEEGKKAYKIKEVPIGAIIVWNDKIIGKGYNMRNSLKNPLMHAEMIAINQASHYLKDWRLENASMFVTVEPCPMCAGAILQSRIENLIFGTENIKAGACGSVINLFEYEFNHKVNVYKNILKEESASLMTDFFKELRNK